MNLALVLGTFLLAIAAILAGFCLGDWLYWRRWSPPSPPAPGGHVRVLDEESER